MIFVVVLFPKWKIVSLFYRDQNSKVACDPNFSIDFLMFGSQNDSIGDIEYVLF